MFERFTERSRKVIVLAQEEARRFSHNYIGTEHLLLGLIREKEGVAAQALQRLGITLAKAHDQVENYVEYGEASGAESFPFTPRSKKVIELSLRESLDFGHNYIGTEHILLGIIRESEGIAARALVDLGSKPDHVRREVVRILRNSGRDETSRAPLQEHSLFLGRASDIEVGRLVMDLEYEYLVRNTAEEVVAHKELAQTVVQAVESEGDPLTIEDAISTVGLRVLDENSAIQKVEVSANEREAPSISVSKTFVR